MASLRKSGLSILGDMPWGSHFCLFYETRQDLLDTVIPYFQAGLDMREFCMWAVSGPLNEGEALSALRQAMPCFDRHLAAGSIEIISGAAWYLEGDRFDPQRVMEGWRGKLSAALARGYEGMRVSGNAFWLQANRWSDFRAYECEIGAAIAGEAMTALCTYPLTRSRAADVLDVARAHQQTLARRRGKWELIEVAEARSKGAALTPRELEVLSWVARGKSAWEIGRILHITKRTVDEHAQTAVRKLGATNRTQAIALALGSHMITAGARSPGPPATAALEGETARPRLQRRRAR